MTMQLVTALVLAFGCDVPSTTVAKIPGGHALVRGTLRFSRDGLHVACVVRKGEKSFPFVDGKLGDAWDDVTAPVLHPSGAHVAFRAFRSDRKQGQWTLLFDGKAVATDDWVGPVALAPNDGAPAYWLSHGWINNADGSLSHGPMALQFGKSKGKKWQATLTEGAPAFTADGKTVVSVGSKGGSTNVLLLDSKGQEKKHWNENLRAIEAAVSPDGTAIAYTYDLQPNRQSYTKGAHRFGVRCEKIGAADAAFDRDITGTFDSAAAPVFSADGRHVAARVRAGEKFGAVLDKGPGVTCEFDFVEVLSISPSGDQLAYFGGQDCKLSESEGFEILTGTQARGGKWVAVRGSQRSAEYDGVAEPCWSADGKRFAFAALAKGKWHVVVDKLTSDSWDAVAGLTWSEDGQAVRYGGLRGEELVWTEIHVP